MRISDWSSDVCSSDLSDVELLHEIGELVVKPARGEQGQGITVGVTTEPELEDAIELAGAHCADVLLEERCEGEDLRIIVIGGSVVAAAVRIPATVVGTGSHTIRDLIQAPSRPLSPATRGTPRPPPHATTKPPPPPPPHA